MDLATDHDRRHDRDPPRTSTDGFGPGRRARQRNRPTAPAPALPDASSSVGERDEIERAFAELTPDQRTVVVLRYYVGLSLEEIAQAIRIPYGTAASRMHYAMRALRAAMDATDRASHEVHTA